MAGENGLNKNNEIIDEILNGVNSTVYEEFDFGGTKKKLGLRPLNSGELEILKKLEKKNQKAKFNLSSTQKGKTRKERVEEVEDQLQNLESDLDYSEMLENQAEVKYQAISWSTEIPIDKIKKLPATIPDDIFERVMTISNITEDDLDLLKNFRKDATRPSDG
jgi:hypothetical protein